MLNEWREVPVYEERANSRLASLEKKLNKHPRYNKPKKENLLEGIGTALKYLFIVGIISTFLITGINCTMNYRHAKRINNKANYIAPNRGETIEYLIDEEPLRVSTSDEPSFHRDLQIRYRDVTFVSNQSFIPVRRFINLSQLIFHNESDKHLPRSKIKDIGKWQLKYEELLKKAEEAKYSNERENYRLLLGPSP